MQFEVETFVQSDAQEVVLTPRELVFLGTCHRYSLFINPRENEVDPPGLKSGLISFCIS